MPRQINWRMVLILAITLISVILVFPTAKYFTFVATTEMPKPGTEAEEEYDEKIQDLKERSITPGLDLQGGVDVLLSVDRHKTQLDFLNRRIEYLKQSFRRDSIAASFQINEEIPAIEVELLNTEDFRAAKNNLEQFSGIFAEFDPAPLQRGESITLSLAPSVRTNITQDAVQGTEEVLRNRVDEFGLSQATVVTQGNNRIRVQIPGEKDPQHVIDNLLRPAHLEFRLVHKQNDSLVSEVVEAAEEDGKTVYTVKEEQVPPGYSVFFGEISVKDPKQPFKKDNRRIPYVLSNEVPLTGASLRESYVEIVQSDIESPIHINLVLDREGARIFKELTENNQRRRLAILLDEEVYTAPLIKETIPDGRCYISGSFDMEEARLVNQVLKAGAIPARLQVEHKQAVGATLGTDTIRSSVKVLLVGAALVIVFMILYYGAAGVIADIALLLNILLILAILSMARATLTLSGIGGILLTVGMAVDANVLIYERIREEILSGKATKVAVKRGFDRALRVIWDSNFTTLITALILLQFAVGSVKGFALTMAIGLLVNLYTGFGVTHAFTDFWVSLRGKINLGILRIFRNVNFNFVKGRYVAYVISSILIVTSIGTLIAKRGPNYAVDFEGGLLAQVQFKQDVSSDDIRTAFADEGFTAMRLQKVTGTNEYLLKMKLIGNDGTQTQNTIQDILAGLYGIDGFEIRGVQQVGNEIGEEFRTIALKSVLIAAIAILIYIGFRFRFIFGVGAVGALLHDTLITIGLLTILGREISLEVVSALLMIIGYSINDTIVIYDRIRENMRSVFGKSFAEIANMSINQSLNRTLLTSSTTFFPMLIMFLFGGKGLADFALTICIGVIIGTYSSSFVATPIVFEWIRRKGFKAATEEKVTKTRYRKVEPIKS
mgnify:CR=1 FL=1